MSSNENDGPLTLVTRVVSSINGVLAQLCMHLAGVGLVILTVIFGWLVYGRYVLNSTPTWVEQVALLLVVFIAFLGAAAGIQEKTHLCVDIFTRKLAGTVKTIVSAFVHVTMAGFGVFLAFYGYKLVVFKWASKIPLIGWSEGLRVMPLFVGGALITLFSIGHILALTQASRDGGEDFPDQEKEGD